MTSPPTVTLKTVILSLFASFIALLTLLIPFPSPAQQPASPKSAATPSALTQQATAPARTLLQPGVARDANTRHVSGPRGSGSQSAASVDLSPFFLQPVFYGSGGGPATSVVIADVNGDGKPDLVVSDGCGPNTTCSTLGEVAVLLGNGDGTFQAVVTYNSGGNAFYGSQAVVADINGDGKPDILVSSFCSVNNCADGTIGVLLGNGDGTFQPVVLYYIVADASSLAVADVNRDGKPDLLVTSPSGEVAVMLGNGDGTFQSAVNYSSGTARAATWISVSDLNGDGKLDLIVGNVSAAFNSLNTISVLLGNGDGTFQPAVSYASGGGQSHISIAVGDLNEDGKPDIIVSEEVPDGGFLGPGSVDVLLGNGDGTFQPAVTYSSGGRGAGGIVLADVNSDGKPDVIVANQGGETGPSVVGVLLSNGDGTLEPAVTYVVGGFGGALSTSVPVAAADLNGDGLTDIVAAECTTYGCSDGGNEVGILLHVGTIHTSTTLTSTPNPSVFGQPVTFNASVTSGAGTPTGTVTFFNNSNSALLGSATLANGRASISCPCFVEAGSQSINAVFGGSLRFDSSASAPLLQVVSPATTKTSIVSSRNPAPPNVSVIYTATVIGQYGVGVTGTVAFRDNGLVVATVGLISNTASYRTTYSTGGSHSITATYSGDRDDTGSKSTILPEYIQTATSTTLASGLNPSVYGQNVTWTAVVTTSGSIGPTGRVNFIWSTFSIGSATLNPSGVATLSRSDLNAYSYPLTAVYLGNADNLKSTSVVLNQVVKQTTSTATLSSSPNPSIQGQAVTFSAKITSPTVVPTGPVTFTAGTTVLGTAQLSSGKATFTSTGLAVGSTIVTVSYPWNSNIAGSSASVTQTVEP